jgi:hypothetical protein
LGNFFRRSLVLGFINVVIDAHAIGPLKSNYYYDKSGKVTMLIQHFKYSFQRHAANPIFRPILRSFFAKNDGRP